MIYGSRVEDGLTFREELDAVRGVLNLQITFVLEEPPQGWTGESGLMREDILERNLPRTDRRSSDYFICGPPVMMDLVERYLAGIGIPPSQIHSERFYIA